MHGGLVVEISEPRQRVGGNEPDASAPGIGDTDEDKIGLEVSGDQAADSLLVERHSLLRRPVGPIADASQVTVEAAVDHDFQLGGEIFPLGLPPGR